MATSGTTSFTLDVDEIIDEAFSRCGGEPITGYEVKNARRSLNLLLQEWINRGILLWTLELTNFTTTQSDLDVTLDTDTVDILDVYHRRDGVDTELVRMSRAEYALLPDKDVEGRPTQFYVERSNLGAPVMYLWPAPENSTDSVYYYKIRRMEDVTASGETLDVPDRWLEALVAGLAHKLSYKRRSVDPQTRQELFLLYERAFNEAAGEERERAGTMLVPDYGSR